MYTAWKLFVNFSTVARFSPAALKKSLKTSPVQQRLSNSTLLTDWSRPIPLTLWNGLRVRRPSGTTPIILLHLYSLFWKWGLGLTQKDSVSKGISSSITYWRHSISPVSWHCTRLGWWGGGGVWCVCLRFLLKLLMVFIPQACGLYRPLPFTPPFCPAALVINKKSD